MWLPTHMRSLQHGKYFRVLWISRDVLHVNVPRISQRWNLMGCCRKDPPGIVPFDRQFCQLWCPNNGYIDKRNRQVNIHSFNNAWLYGYTVLSSLVRTGGIFDEVQKSKELAVKSVTPYLPTQKRIGYADLHTYITAKNSEIHTMIYTYIYIYTITITITQLTSFDLGKSRQIFHHSLKEH